MNLRIRKYFGAAFLWMAMFGMGGINARASVVTGKQVLLDTTSKVDVRPFSVQKLMEYRRSPDFQYKRTAPEGLSWWERLKEWFWQKIVTLIDAGTHTGAGRTVLILLVTGIAIYVIIKMAGIDKGGFLGKKNEHISLPYVTENDIHSVDFDQVIHAAIQQHNYRLAVRLWYLKTLKKLADKEFIQWKPGKTNYEYVTELAGTPYSNDFIRLTHSFEYCWYGEMSVAASEYEMLQSQFADFNQQLF